jgi:hypothetical protein
MEMTVGTLDQSGHLDDVAPMVETRGARDRMELGAHAP